MRNKRFVILGCLLFALCQLALAQYEVLTLDSCLRSAQQRNCTIRSAQLEVAISREVKKQMLWKYFPQVSLSGFAFGAAKPLIEIDAANPNLSGGLGTFLSEIANYFLEDLKDSINTDISMVRWGVSAPW